MTLDSLPPPDEDAVHLHRQGQQLGPMSRRELHRRVRVGEADPEDHFWLPGMDGWETIASRPELFEDLEAPPANAAPAPGAGTVMIPRSALGDLAGVEGFADAGADDPGSSTVLVSTLQPTGSEPRAASSIGAATVRFAPGTDMEEVLREARQQRAAGPASPSAEPDEAAPGSVGSPAVEATVGAPVAEDSGAPAGAEISEDPGDDTSPVGALAAEDVGALETGPVEQVEAGAASEEDEQLEGIFGELVESTWQILQESRFARHVDEVFLGALISSALDAGWSLIDLESDGSHHFLRFEDLDDTTRMILRVRHLTGDTARKLARRGQQVLGKISACPRPVIACVNGYALGGGLELALACHFRYAVVKAKLGLPEVSLGLIPGYGGTQRLTRAIGRGPATEMIVGGDPIDGPEALRIGLVNKIFETKDAMLAAASETLQTIGKRGPLAVSLALEAIERGLGQDLPGALEVEADLFGVALSSGDGGEGTKAFLEKRKPEFKGN